MRFSRTKVLRRCLLSSVLLASGAVASAADQSDNMGLLQGLITGRRAETTQSVPQGQASSVQAELQKLFQTGQVQTSQHQSAAATGAVRQIQHESEGQSPGLFRQIFGTSTAAERRAKRQQDRLTRSNPQSTNRAPSVPKPPPIDFAMQQRAQKRASISAKTVGLSREISTPPGVPPVGHIADGQYTLKPTEIDPFVSPFIDDESLERSNIVLDLDSLIDRPADRSEAMPITTEGDAVERLIQLPIPLKQVAPDPLAEANTVTLPAVDAVLSESVNTVREQAEPMAELLNIEASAIDVAETIDSEQQNTVSVPNENTAQTEPVPKVEVAEIEESVESEEVMVIQSEVAPTKVVDAEATVAAQDDHQQPEPDAKTQAAQKQRLSVQEENARRQQQRYLILSRAGRSGFKGFCPVALRQTRMLRDSSTNHAARFGLKTYYFSSDDARLQFEADPARYAPAAGGSDVVLLANTGEETEGSLDFCLWYRDRLYMFRSRETQAIFSADPAQFANQY
ncbi:MAG: hypothetical protein ABJZ55_19370 [Fuerstiella sp.]